MGDGSQSHRRTGDIDQIHVESLFAKKTLIAGNKKRSFAFAQYGVANDDLAWRRSSVKNGFRERG